MKTMTTYKVVWIDLYGDLQEKDFDDITQARDFSSSVNDSILYEIKMLGSIERIV